MREQLKDLIVRFRRLWLPVAVGFFIIVYIALGVVYFQQHGRHNYLSEQIATLTARMPEQSAAEIEEKIAEAQADLDAAKSIFPTDLDATKWDVIAEIAALASATGVSQIGSMPELTKEETAKISNITYQYLRYTVDVQATAADADSTLNNVRDFITKLDKGQTALKSLIVDQVTLAEIGVWKASQGVYVTRASIDFSVYILSE